MKKDKKILMTHLYYGDPSEEFSLKLAQTLFDSGADMLEIGIPYTDPVCDGEIFRRSCSRALSGGITPLKVFEGIRALRQKGYHQPIYLTSYFAPVFKMGVGNFVKKAKEAGVTGLIIPDILLEEQKELRNACRKNNLSLIQFATIYSDKNRLRQICRASTDFIYCISLPGVTGDKSRERNKLFGLIKSLKKLTDEKIFVGFGIKSAKEAKEILSFGADGVVVGSAVARIYEKYINDLHKSLGKISIFIKSIKSIL